jgi:hypothetical protein
MIIQEFFIAKNKRRERNDNIEIGFPILSSQGR